VSEDHDKRIAELERQLAEQKKINRVAELEAQIASQKSGQAHEKSGFQRTTAKPMRQQSDEERRADADRKILELYSKYQRGEITGQEYADERAHILHPFTYPNAKTLSPSETMGVSASVRWILVSLIQLVFAIGLIILVIYVVAASDKGTPTQTSKNATVNNDSATEDPDSVDPYCIGAKNVIARQCRGMPHGYGRKVCVEGQSRNHRCRDYIRDSLLP
jgi:hypothetical protein